MTVPESQEQLVTRRNLHLTEVLLVIALVGVFLFLSAYGWFAYTSFGVTGFDTGIFAQGAWLLAQLDAPFVTISGLNVLGDHASMILVLLAPFYKLWPDARLLLILQAAALTVPAYVAYRVGREEVSQAIGVIFAVVYLLLPAMQWAHAWMFHPESIAVACLSLAVLALRGERWKLLTLCLALALLCKEDVSFVVFGFGALMWISGKRRPGAFVMLGAAAYFLIVIFIVMPSLTEGGNRYFARNYGVQVDGAMSLFPVGLTVLGKAIETAASSRGLTYLTLAIGPLLFLPLLRPLWLLPAAVPLILNLGSDIPYSQEIRFHYLATSAPFFVLAAIFGLQRITKDRSPLPTALAVLIVATLISASNGALPDMWRTVTAGTTEVGSSKAAALSRIPAGASVSASWELDVHLTNRREVYEFPNPFAPGNWGVDDEMNDRDRRIEQLQYVAVTRSAIDEELSERLTSLQSSPQWTTIYDDGDVIILRRAGPPVPE